MHLLVKDPEIHSKTWMLEVRDNAPIAEIVGRFLLHRGAGHISQPCLLRMFYESTTLTEKQNMSKTFEELGIPLKSVVLQSMWSINAGHVSSKCKDCRTIIDLVTENTAATQTSETKPESFPPIASNTNSTAPRKLSDFQKKTSKKSKSKPIVLGNDKTIANRLEGNPVSDTGLGPVSTLTDGNADTDDFSQGQHKTSIVATLHTLERMVTMCLSANDLVDRLERLACLRRNQELTDMEFAKAKQKLLDS